MNELTPAQQLRISNEFRDKVEELFDLIDRGALDVIKSDGSDFIEFKPYLKNWDVLLEVIEEEREEGYSEKWADVMFVWE